jgi:hypothetical protein
MGPTLKEIMENNLRDGLEHNKCFFDSDRAYLIADGQLPYLAGWLLQGGWIHAPLLLNIVTQESSQSGGVEKGAYENIKSKVLQMWKEGGSEQ